jgi:hypothetical protein
LTTVLSMTDCPELSERLAGRAFGTFNGSALTMGAFLHFALHMFRNPPHPRPSPPKGAREL